jgi:predicted Zn-dependent peptidase
MPSVRSVALGFWIGVGSRDETPAKAGLTHFIEHLLFKDTRSFDARRIAEIFDELGGELNAATSREHTVVYGRVPYDQLERAVDVMTDMVFVPTFADLDAEREVVLEEIAMVDDAPQDRVHDLVSEAVFGDHPLGRPVLGRSEVISSVSRRTIAAYHESMYQPGNVVVSAAGNVAHERLVSLVTRAANAREHAAAKPYVRRQPQVSRARRPSSTTSASRLRASPAPTGAASPPRCSTRFSAARPPRGCSRRSARSAAWLTPSTVSSPSTPTPA